MLIYTDLNNTSLPATKSAISFSVTFVLGFLTTQAIGNSPATRSGRPTTPTSATAGWVRIMFSSSDGGTWNYNWVIPCQLIHFFADPSPILMKFGKLGGQQKKLIHTKFQHISTIFNGVRAL